MSNNRVANGGNYKDATGTIRNIIDRTTGNPASIRTDHRYIHRGIAYGIEFDVEEFGNNETKYFTLETSAEKYTHFKNVSAIDCLAVIYEDVGEANIDETGATELNIYNRNRVAETERNMETAANSKLLSIDPDLTNGKAIKKYQGDYVSNTEEVVLLRGHKYIIAVTNLSGSQADVFIEALFYEEDEG